MTHPDRYALLLSAASTTNGPLIEAERFDSIQAATARAHIIVNASGLAALIVQQDGPGWRTLTGQTIRHALSDGIRTNFNTWIGPHTPADPDTTLSDLEWALKHAHANGDLLSPIATSGATALLP